MVRSLLRTVSRKLTYANVVATLALFIALGGVSYAAVKLPKNSVGSTQLKKGAVTLPKISKRTQRSLKGAAGPTGSPGKDGGTGPSDAYLASGYTDAVMPGDGANLGATTLLPAGKYTVVATYQLTNTANVTQNIHCYVQARTVDGPTAQTFGQGSSIVLAGAGADASIAVSGSIELTADDEYVNTYCTNDGSGPGGVAISNSVVVTKVGSLHYSQ